MKDLEKLSKTELIAEIKKLQKNQKEIVKNAAEKRATEIKLKESEEKFRALYDNAPLSYQSLNEDGSFKDINPTWLNTLGYKREEIIGKFYKDFLHPEWKAHFENNFPKFKKRGYVNDVKFKIRHKDGHYLDISFEGCVGYNPDGSFKQTYCVFQDITKRKIAEEELLRNEEKLNLIISSSPIGICTADKFGNFITTNRAYEQILGFTKEELLKLSFFEITHPEDRPHNKQLFQKMFSMETSDFSIEKRYIRKDGKEIIVSINAVGIKDTTGKTKYGTAFVEDITDRKQAEEIIKNQATKWQTTFNAMSDSVCIINLNGKISQHNTSTLSLFKINSEDIKEKKCFEIVHGIDKFYNDCPLSRMKKSHQRESMIFKQDEFWLEVSVDPIFNSKNELTGAVHVVSDITNRRLSEKKITESLEQLDLALEGANAGLWSWNIKTGEDYLDERWCAILGYTKDELKQHVSTWEQLMHPDDKERVMERVNMHFKNKKNEYKVEYRMKCKNGEWKWIFAAGKIVKRDANDEPLQMTGIITDINEQKLAEEKIRTTEKNLKNTFDLSPSIISKVNIDKGYFIEVNQAVTKILGYSVEEFTSIPFMELIHPDDRHEAVSEVSEQLSGKEVTSFVNRYLCKDGTYKWMEWNGTKADENGLVTAIGIDVHERKLAEHELAKYRENLEELVKERTKNLEQQNIELERLNDIFVDREFRIKELRDEIMLLKTEK